MSLLRTVRRTQRSAAADRAAQTATRLRGSGSTKASSPGTPSTGPAADTPPAELSPGAALAGELVTLRHLATVRPGTFVLVFIDDAPPLIKRPGEYVWPDRRPWEKRVRVLPVTTLPVRLLVRLTDLTTLDGERLSVLELRVVVQFAAGDVVSGLTELATQHSTDLGDHVAETVRRSVEVSVRAAVGANRRADLRRQTVLTVLEDRWVPRAFAGAVLTRRPLELVTETWADPTTPERPAPRAEPADSGDGPAPGLELSTDVRLLRLWRRHLATDPVAIAGAQINGRSSVVAVVSSEPPAFETRELWEDIATLYQDDDPCLLLVRGTTYEEIAGSWFAQLEVGSGMIADVTADAARDRLVVRLPRALSHPRWQGPDGSQVAALRRLLPHRTVDITLDER